MDNNTNNKYLHISGTIGFKILQNDKINKKIFIFFDDHNNNKYCNNKSANTNNQIFISDLFNSLITNDSNNLAMILEEPFIDPKTKIKILWENTKHLTLFRKFYSKLLDKCSKTSICKIFPADVRMSLFDVSIDEIIFNIDNKSLDYDISLELAFDKFCYLFDINYKSNSDSESELDSDSILFFIKRVLDVWSTSNYYQVLKKTFVKFYNEFVIPNKNLTIYEMIKKNLPFTNFKYEQGFPFINNLNDKSNNNFLDQIDKISSGIMELYTMILLLLLPNNNIIIYAGYYHSNNLAFILEKYYDFNVRYDIAHTNNIDKVNKDNIPSCCIIDKSFLILI